MNDAFGLAPIRMFDSTEARNPLEPRNASEADKERAAEEQEIIDLTRQVRLQSLKMMPDILTTCGEFIKDAKLSVKDRLSACREVRECAGIAKVIPPMICIDQRTMVATAEEQQWLFEMGMAGPPQGARARPMIDTTAVEVPDSAPQPEPADELPGWAT